jgi:hypothetical protein
MEVLPSRLRERAYPQRPAPQPVRLPEGRCGAQHGGEMGAANGQLALAWEVNGGEGV